MSTKTAKVIAATAMIVSLGTVAAPAASAVTPPGATQVQGSGSLGFCFVLPFPGSAALAFCL